MESPLASSLVSAAPVWRCRPGRFDGAGRSRAAWVEPVPRRVRAVLIGEVVVETERAVLVGEPGQPPRYAFPPDDVVVATVPDPGAPGYVTVAWDEVDAWFEEDERIEVHPRDPWHRVDTYATSRRVTVYAGDRPIADSTATIALHETGCAPVHYVPKTDTRLDLLCPSGTTIACAYKGVAQYWHVVVDGVVIEDAAWEFRHRVRREGERVHGMLAFSPERLRVDVAGTNR